MDTAPYYCVTDDDDGCVTVDAPDGAIASYVYASRTQRAQARLRAEAIAEKEAHEHGGDWGCNY